MKTNQTHFEQFEALLKQKAYEDLSEKEQKLVAEFCESATEYDFMKKMISSPAPIMTSEPSIHQDLWTKLQDNRQPSEYQRFISARVPLWLYLFSLLGVALLVYFWRPNPVKTKEIIKEVPKEIIKKDTVVQYAYRTDTVFIQKGQSTKRASTSNRTIDTLSIKQAHPTKRKNKAPTGRSIKQDPDLRVFITDIGRLQ